MKRILILAIVLTSCASTLPTPNLGAGDTVIELEGKCWVCHKNNKGVCDRIDMEFCGQEPQLAEQPESELTEEEPAARIDCNSCELDIEQPGMMSCTLAYCNPEGSRVVHVPYLITIGDRALVLLRAPVAKP